MRQISTRFREQLKVHVGLRYQIALLGISGVVVTGTICAAAFNYASLVQSAWTDSSQFKAHVASLSRSFLESRKSRAISSATPVKR